MKGENISTKKAVAVLEAENRALSTRVEELDAYSKGNNLIFHGLPQSSFAESASADQGVSSGSQRCYGVIEGQVGVETSVASETTVIQFVNDVLNIPLTRDDISVAHRLRKLPNDSRPAPLVVRFTNRRARNAVYAARKSLASYKPTVYINEHLTKERASLFREARLLVKS